MSETATKTAGVDSPPKIESFHHVSLPCRDLEEGIRFYTEVMGGRVRVKETITHVLSGLERVPEAFEITANKGKYRAINPAQVVLRRRESC